MTIPHTQINFGPGVLERLRKEARAKKPESKPAKTVKAKARTRSAPSMDKSRRPVKANEAMTGKPKGKPNTFTRMPNMLNKAQPTVIQQGAPMERSKGDAGMPGKARPNARAVARASDKASFKRTTPTIKRQRTASTASNTAPKVRKQRRTR
jgi:hypothetical protein